MKTILSLVFITLFTFSMANAQEGRYVPPKTRIEATPNPVNIFEEGSHRSATGYYPSGSKIPSIVSVDNGLSIQRSNAKNKTIWISGRSRNVIQSRTKVLKEKVNLYLQDVSELTMVSDEDLFFKIIEESSDDLQMTHVKVQQTYKGIPIYGAESFLHLKEYPESFHGKIYRQTPDIEVTPSLTEDLALKYVISDVPDYRPIPQGKFDLFKNNSEKKELVIYPYENKLSLAYHVTFHNNLIDRWEYFIDAHTGTIIHKFQSICKFHNHDLPNSSEEEEEERFMDGVAVANGVDLNGSTRTLNTYNVGNGYYLVDASRPMYKDTDSKMPNEPVGVIWTIDAFNTSPKNDNFNYDHVFSADNNWSGKETSISAHYNAGKSYEYFKSFHNRESLNALGGNIISLVNIADEDGSSLENAFWNGSAMFYGNGGNSFKPLASGLDVAAHEITHGVVQNSANLEYQGESGAMNESFADIFGVMVEREDWLIGEDVVKTSAFPSGALRNLMDPHNGAAQGDYGKGFQPKHMDEKFNGAADNGGVHINSGIPNHAFYLFATLVGVEKAETIFYRALTVYLLKSSQFIDLRLAIIQAATDLDSDNDGAEVAAAKSAFDQVGILDGEAGNYQQDVEANTGNTYLLATSDDNKSLYLYDKDLNPLFLLYDGGVLKKPSVTDDGSAALFVGTDNRIYGILFNWGQGNPTVVVFENQPIWRNAVVSRDGRRFAALFNDQSNRVFVKDFIINASATFILYNPTFTEGITTSDVKFADALEFDFSGDNIAYDALSVIPSTNSDPISTYDIGFLNIWNKAAEVWSLGSIEKLFTTLPENTSVGNPTFSKNSPYIIAFDRIVNNRDFFLMAANLETGALKNLVLNAGVNFPSYYVEDDKILIDLPFLGSYDLLSLGVESDKITFVRGTDIPVLQQRRWGVWFADGQRDLNTSVDNLEKISILSTYPNPTAETLNVAFQSNKSENGRIEIFGVNGVKIFHRNISTQSGENLYDMNVSAFPEGVYMIKIQTEEKFGSKLFIKQ